GCRGYGRPPGRAWGAFGTSVVVENPRGFVFHEAVYVDGGRFGAVCGGWQLGEQAGHATPRRMQALLAEYTWDWRTVLGRLQQFILAHLADPGAILVLDETAELKKGRMTVGVARQHAGITGQTGNCQTVVFLAYVTARAHTLFSFRLYLPKPWCEDTARRERAQVPEGTMFATKTVQGTEMVAEAVTASVPFGWAAGDEVYGRSSKLRAACEDAGKGYVFAVP